jgi:hypothetical protein
VIRDPPIRKRTLAHNLTNRGHDLRVAEISDAKRIARSHRQLPARAGDRYLKFAALERTVATWIPLSRQVIQDGSIPIVPS